MNPEQMEAYMNQKPSSLSNAARAAMLSSGVGYGVDAGMGLMSGAGKKSFKAAIPSAMVSAGLGGGISLTQSILKNKEFKKRDASNKKEIKEMENLLNKQANILSNVREVLDQQIKVFSNTPHPSKRFPIEITQQVFSILLEHPHRINNGFDIKTVEDLSDNEKEQIKNHARIVVKELRERGIQSVSMPQVEEMLYDKYKKRD